MVQSLASDPTVTEALGQLWYNSSSNVWKVAIEGSGAWSAGGNLTRPPSTINSGAGTLTAGLVFGGTPYPYPPVDSTYSEEYDGTSWTEGNNLPTACHMNAGAGSQTAALSIGGKISTSDQVFSFEYNGTSWGDGGDLPSGKSLLGALGIQTAAMALAGSPAPTNTSAYSYDGTSWTEEATLTIPRISQPGGAGTTTAGICFAGENPAASPIEVVETEEWNGTGWSEGGDLNTGRHYVGVGQGTATDALCVGGSVSPKQQTEIYNGTSWTETGDLATGRAEMGQSAGINNTSTSWCCGGYPFTNTTEEFANPVLAIKTVTTS